MDAPLDLSPEAIEQWPKLVAELCFVHNVPEPAASDLHLLAAVLRAEDRLRSVTHEIDHGGYTVKGRRNSCVPTRYSPSSGPCGQRSPLVSKGCA
jgi:hypothetical protein